LDFLNLRFLDIVDILLVATLLYYLYKLVRGSAAINIFIGIVIIYGVWQLTKALNMLMLSTVLGGFIGVGMFALIVVFQQEIRQFLLMVGSTNFASRKKFFKQLKFLKDSTQKITSTNVTAIIKACEHMSGSKTGALIVIKRHTSLDFVKSSGDQMQNKVNIPIIESIFYKNSPLHDGAMIVENDYITATRVILPVSSDINIPLRFGLRHRAAVSITQKTDALALVVSEENGRISYIKNGTFVKYATNNELIQKLTDDLV